MSNHVFLMFAAVRRKARENLSDMWPALIILCGVLNGVLLPVALDSGRLTARLCYALPLAVLSFAILPRTRAVFFLLASLAGIVSLHIIDCRHERDNQTISTDLRSDVGLVVRIVDPACCGPEIPWLPNPAMLRAELIRIKSRDESCWRDASGKIALRLPRDAPLLSYGDIIELSGSFPERSRWFVEERVTRESNAAEDASPITLLRLAESVGSRSFARYLRTRGIRHVFVAREFAGQLDERGGVYGALLGFRNAVLRLAAADIASDNHRRMLATLLFGCRQGVERETKRAYIQSGTIHIFTVSGLHVGILALMLFWLLRWAPFRIRYILMPLLIACYAAITGMQPPAARALLMLAIWCWSRAFLLNIPTLNVVFLAASMLLLKNPYYIHDMGFQFSFLVVGFLIAAARHLREWIDLSREARRWIPDGQVGRLAVCREQCLSKFIAGIGGCLVAWLAGSGISLYYQGIFFPFSIVANFILVPIVLLLFNLIFLKIFLGWLPWASALLANVLDGVVGWVNGFVFLVDELFDSTAAIRPGLVSLSLFYLSLSVLVTARTRLRFVSGLGGLLGVIVFWHAAGRFMLPGVIILHGGEAREASIVIHEPALGSAVAINMPSFGIADCTAELLARKGIRKISKLVFTANTKEYSAGADALFDRLKVDEIVQLEPGRRGRSLMALIRRATENGIVWRQGGAMQSGSGAEFVDAQLDIRRENQRLFIEYAGFSMHIRVVVESLAPGRRRVTMFEGSKAEAELVLTNSSIVEVKEYVFKQ